MLKKRNMDCVHITRFHFYSIYSKLLEEKKSGANTQESINNLSSRKYFSRPAEKNIRRGFFNQSVIFRLLACTLH